MRKMSMIGVGFIRHADTYYYLRYAAFFLIILCGLTLALPSTTSAITPISQGFSTDDDLSLGSIVSMRTNSTTHIVGSTSIDADNILGVVISNSSSLLSLSNGQDNQVQVATSGTVDVLVSDINGDIVKGDQLTSSPIKGVGMKATSNVKVVGIAQGDLSQNSTSKETYTDSTGKLQSVTLGQIPVLINVSYFYKQPDKTIIPTAIQNIANGLAGKTVNAVPIIISGAIFLVMIIVVMIIIYSMIRSSIISVGRNPMSQSAVYRDVIQLSALVLVILGVGLISIYMVLTRL